MRERLPVLLTLVVVLAVGATLAARRGGWYQRPPGKAEDRLAAAMAAASRGDTPAYLACFSASLGEALGRAAAEVGHDAFGAELQRRSREMTGWAVSRVPPGDGRESVILRLEAVFRDRVEAQDYELRTEAGRWRIAALGQARVTRMPIAYGTPVGAETGAGNTTDGPGAQATP